MKNKPVLATISLLFLVFSIYAGVLLFMDSNTDTRGQAASTPTISISVDQPSYSTNTNFATTLKLDTANKPIDDFLVEINYNPEILDALSIKPFDIFPSQDIKEQSIDHQAGSVLLHISPQVGTPPSSFTGSAAIIVFRGIQPNPSANISFSSQTSATLTPDQASILTTQIPTSVEITP